MLKMLFKKFWAYIVIIILSVSLYRSMHNTVTYHKKANVLENTISDLHQQIKFAEIQLNDSIKVYQAEVKKV